MAKNRKLNIVLSKEQRQALERTVKCGTGKAMDIRRANVLLLADESENRKRNKDVVIADMLGITVQAVHDIKKKFLDTSSEDRSYQGNTS